MVRHSCFFSEPFNILTKLLRSIFWNRITYTGKFIPWDSSTFHFQLFYLLRKCQSWCTCHAYISTIVFSLWFQIIRSVFPRFYRYNNNCFAIYCLWLNIRNNLRHTGIRNCISNSIHQLKQHIIFNTNNLMCFIIHSNNQLTTLCIGKSYDCLHVFFTFIW